MAYFLVEKAIYVPSRYLNSLQRTVLIVCNKRPTTFSPCLQSPSGISVLLPWADLALLIFTLQSVLEQFSSKRPPELLNLSTV